MSKSKAVPAAGAVKSVEGPPSLCSSLEVDAIAFHALEKIAKKEIEGRELRTHLVDGQSYGIDLHFLGKVDNKVVRLHTDGTLNVGHSDPAYPCSSAPEVKRMLVLLLSFQAEALREQNLLLIEGAFADGAEPEVPAELLERVEALLTKLRRQSTRFQNGPVKLLYALRKSDQKIA